MHKLNVGYQTLCWLTYPEKHYGVEEVVREVREAGFAGIEFAEQMQHFNKVPDFPALMKEEGMAMASLSSGVSYNRDETLEETKKRGEFGAQFGVKALMLCGGWGPESSTKEERLFDGLAANIDELGEFLAKFDMKPSFHPHLDTLVETREDTERLLGKMKYGHLCLDIAHFDAAGSDPIVFFRDYTERIAMVHLKDFVDDPTSEICGVKGRFCELGQGRVDVKGFLDAAVEAEYEGWLVVELDSTSKTPLESAKMSYEFLRSGGYV